MSWLDALKVFNAGGNNWCIPRKGTAEYDQVKAIMHGTAIHQPHSPAFNNRQLTQGQTTYTNSVQSIEHRAKIRALAQRVRPRSRRGD